MARLSEIPFVRIYQLLLSLLFFLAPLVWSTNTVTIVDVKVFLVKLIILLLWLTLLIQAIFEKQFFVSDKKIFILIIAYCSWQIFAIMLSQYGDAEILEAQVFVSLFFVFLILSPLNLSTLKPVVFSIIASALIAGLYAILEHYDIFYFHKLKLFSDGPGASTLGHKNFSSVFFVLSLPFSIFYALHETDRKYRTIQGT